MSSASLTQEYDFEYNLNNMNIDDASISVNEIIDSLPKKTKKTKPKIVEIVSPVAKDYKNKTCEVGKPDSKRDYESQQERYKNGEVMMWDDTKYNQAVIGLMFGFVHNKKFIEWHEVIDIKPPEFRLREWEQNEGQYTRQVLILSDCKEIEPYNSWITRHEYNPTFTVQGTFYVKKS